MNKKIILLLFTCVAYNLIYEQDSLKQTPDIRDTNMKRIGNRITVLYQLLKGQIVLVNGDTFKGYFSTDAKNVFHHYNACYFWKTGSQKPIQRISITGFLNDIFLPFIFSSLAENILKTWQAITV